MAEVYLVRVIDGEYADPELIGAHRTQEGAVKRCNEHRKLYGGDPITWEGMQGWDQGVSRHCKQDLGRHGVHKFTCTYTIEPMVLGD